MPWYMSEARGQLVGVYSGARTQAWLQPPLPVEPSCWLHNLLSNHVILQVFLTVLYVWAFCLHVQMYICAPHVCLVPKNVVILHVVLLGTEPRSFIDPEMVLKAHHSNALRLVSSLAATSSLIIGTYFETSIHDCYHWSLPLFCLLNLLSLNHHNFPFIKPG